MGRQGVLGPIHAEGARWGEPTRHTLCAAWEEGRRPPGPLTSAGP